MTKLQKNTYVDLIIGLAFVASAISGLVFLIPLNWYSGAVVLGITFRTWNVVHTWSSLVMIAGVVLHLILHWRWIVCRVRPRRRTQRRAVGRGNAAAQPCDAGQVRTRAG